jgi:hypothetical protein
MTASERSRAEQPKDLREATLATLHQLSERLTAITNYLEAALRLSRTAAPAAGVSSNHGEILQKTVAQVSQADEAIKRLRRLLVEDAGRSRTPAQPEELSPERRAEFAQQIEAKRSRGKPPSI